MPPENNYNIRKIIIFGILILLVAALIGFLVIRQKNISDQTKNQKNLFPFDNGTGSHGTTGSGTTPADQIPNPVPVNPLTVPSSERLRIVANYAVTGFYPSVVNKITSQPQLDAATGQSTLVPMSTPTNMVRFNAKQNGLLVDAEMTNDSIVVSQKSETEIPDAEELWFGNGGNTVTYRSWNGTSRSIDSFNGSLPNSAPLSYCQVPFTTILKKKSKGSEVKELQKYLNAKLSLNLVIDGSFGSKITAALKPLQKTLGIPVSGTYDQTTLAAINTDCASINADYSSKNDGVQKLTGGFMTPNILRGSVSPDGTQVFFLKPSNDGIVGIVANIDGTKQRQIFSSPLTEWKPQWINATTIAMTTLASREAQGYLYFLDVSTGSFKKILGPIRGLTTLVNPNGTMVLASQSTDRGFVLGTYSVTTGVAQKLDLVTLPEKCTWQDTKTVICAVPQGIPDGQYPDDWYQGNLAFSDTFWSIDTSNNTTVNLFSPSQSFDAINLGTSPDGSYLYFINRINGNLWSYRLSD